MRLLVLFMVLGLGLAGCTMPGHRLVNGQPVAGQSFAHVEPLSVNVGKVEIVDRSGAAVMPDDFVFSLPDQAILYLSRKFETVRGAGEQQGYLLIRIEEANVMKGQQGGDDWFGVTGQDRYVLLMRLALEHRAADGRVLYGKTVTAEQRFSIAEFGVSPARREQKQLEAVEKLFGVLDPKITEIVTQDMRL